MHAFCGCSTESVLGALGLTLSDLFDRPLGTRLAPSHSRPSARDVLSALDHEVTIVAMIAEGMKRGTVLPTEVTRLAVAARRIGAARDLCSPAEVRRAR
jgi:hypothetical protein